MPLYVYQGEHPRMLFGLSHGVNADHHAADGTSPLPVGSTVVVEFEDTVRTDEPYPHVDLVEINEPPVQEPDPAVEPPAKSPRTRRAKNTEE